MFAWTLDSDCAGNLLQTIAGMAIKKPPTNTKSSGGPTRRLKIGAAKK
jgi:hypothetical protein